MNNQLLTVQQVSTLLQVHPKTIYRWKEEGCIPYVNLNGLVRFRKTDIENWQCEYSFKPAPPLIDSLQHGFSIRECDKLFLKGDSAVSKSKRRWNYGFGQVYIRKTKGGKERWYIDYTDETGRRVQRVVKNASHRDEAMIALQSEIAKCFHREHGTKPQIQEVQLPKFVEMFIEDYSKVNKTSWRDDEIRLGKWAEFLGNVRLQDVTPVEIERFKTKRLTDGVSKSTVNRYLAILKRLYNIAIEWGYAKENPVRRIKFYSEADCMKERILTAEEEDRLLEAASAHLKPILIVALNTGMRRGEILKLTWDRVDIEKEQIFINKTKSGKPRIVDMNSTLISLFTQLRSRDAAGGYVFLNPKTGKPFNKVQKSFDGACERTGIQDLRFHDLRHTFASRLIAAGVDLIRVKELLGHSTVRITERYTHASREDKKKAVELLCRNTAKNGEKRDDLLHICDTDENGKKVIQLNRYFSVN
ncbi:MAG: tyrosine-type recombinase/integrase [Proteobacteria bacterium]|nr:tyrosine-type recombinase/integrase [Pseudomonadota bacterium]